MSKQEWLKLLSETKNEEGWCYVCDSVKAWTKTIPEAERSGEYPVWWWSDVIMSGLLGRVSKGWTK